MSVVPPVAFIGLVERVAQVFDGPVLVRKHNLLGLKKVVYSNIFPLQLRDFSFALAFYSPAADAKYKFKLVDEFGRVVSEMEMTIAITTPVGFPKVSDDVEEGAHAMPMLGEGWVFNTIGGGLANMFVRQPGILRLFLAGTPDALLGEIRFVVVDPEPLTAERIAAIRSNPTSAKFVRIRIACHKCGEALKAYAGLDKLDTEESDGWLWYQNLPDHFTCGCSHISCDLSILRRNFHALLGSDAKFDGSIALVPLYEEQAMQTLRANFAALLSEVAPEETFQKFIEANPLVLHSFSPHRLFFKPPILTAYRCDFAILTPQRELVLLELEKPNTRILKKDGGLHSDLQHAFDQARNWLHTADEHRAATLECMQLSISDVGAVRAVVIAGRDIGNDEVHLRRLKSNDYGRVRFMTYDDLLGGLDALLRAVRAI